MPQIIEPKGLWIPHATMEEVLAGLGDLEKLNTDELKRLALVKQEIARRQRLEPIRFYRPYESRLKPGRKPQDLFHRSQAKIRLFIGGNRSGKSEGGIIEDLLTAKGIHPYRKNVVPNHGWIVSLDFPTSRDVVEVKLRQWLSPYDIKKWDKQERIIYLKNGSTIGLRSCDQDIQKFGGSAKHWIHFDEEPPGERGKKIYEECLMRLMDYRGHMWFTLTPVSGMSWTYDELYERTSFDPDVFVVEVETLENPYIDEKEIEIISRKLGQDELEMRLKGKYIQFSGLVYKEFNREDHIVKPFPIPDHWKKYRAIDHGINNPTACLFVAINEKDELYVYDEYYETDKTVSENAEAIRSITGNDRITWTVIDPSTANRDPITNTSVRDEYRRCGVITKAQRTDRMAGINAVKQLLRPNEVTKRPRLFIFDTCFNLIKEMSRYRWKVYRGSEDKNKAEEPQKVLDHALDALRYLVMSRPQYDLYEDFSDEERPTWYS
jgi:phage terminase large subunit